MSLFDAYVQRIIIKMGGYYIDALLLKSWMFNLADAIEIQMVKLKE